VEKDGEVIEPQEEGCRHIDRVLDTDYVQNLGDLTLILLRDKRDRAAREETKLSYLRRLLHARIDIVRAEQQRRSLGSQQRLVDQLAAILSENAVSSASRSDRHQHLAPPGADECLHQAEELIGNSNFTDVGALSNQELVEVLDTYVEEEVNVSTRRRRVQQVVDAINAEIAARYARGTASVDELLARERTSINPTEADWENQRQPNISTE